MIKNIASIERKIQLLERPAGPMLRPPQNTQVNTPVPVFANTGVNIPQPMQHVNMSAPPLMNAPERNNDMRTNSPLNADVFVPNSARQQQTWAEIVQNTPGSAAPLFRENTERPIGGWRQGLHLLHGEGGEATQGGSFAADVDIVAYNVSKNVTAENLYNWLAQKGIHVKYCTLLTTTDQARSLAFKVTIDPKDYDRATKDASIWPYRVGVRLFKAFKKSSSNNGYRNDSTNNGDRPERIARDGTDHRSRENTVLGNRGYSRSGDQESSRNDRRYDNYQRY